MKQKLLFAIAAAILLLGFFLASKLYTGAQQEQGTQHAALNQANLVRMHSPTQGPAEARVQIVEFFDPACETCRNFHPFVKELMATHPGQIRLAMRYTPFHSGSELVVRILEAARRQGRYWETLEALYAAQDDWVQHHSVQPDRVWPHLEQLGLDLERLKQDLDAPEIGAVVAQDMEDARVLKVEKTPEFFVNGRPLPSFGREQLRRLVEDAVAASYP
jgi:protein-disulfide isomerase